MRHDMSVCACLMWESQLWVRKALLPMRHSIQERLHTRLSTHQKEHVVQRSSVPTVNRGKQPLCIVLDELHTLCVWERTFEPR